MRNAYALLGLSFLIVFIGVYFVVEKANAPVVDEVVVPLVDVDNEPTAMSLTLTSPAFNDGELIPSKYTCDGENVNPELHIGGVPEGTESLVLVMDDPDIPDAVKKSMGTEKFDHWVLYNIPPDTEVIAEATSAGSEGVTSRGEEGYTGPCPPDREHRYLFRLYALSGSLNFIKAPTLDEVEVAAQGMSIEGALLTGRYERLQN